MQLGRCCHGLSTCYQSNADGAVLPLAGNWQLHPSGERMCRQPSDASSQLSRSRSGSRSGSRRCASDAGSTASETRNGATYGNRSSSSGSNSGSGAGSGAGSSGSSQKNEALPDGLPDGPGAGYPPAHAAAAARTLHLFAFPAESNFSGARYGLSLAAAVAGSSSCAAALEADPPEDSSKPTEDGSGARPPSGAQQRLRSSGSTESASGEGNGRWLVVLDAAKACGSHPPDLAAHPVDFVVRPAAALHSATSARHSAQAQQPETLIPFPCCHAQQQQCVRLPLLWHRTLSSSAGCMMCSFYCALSLAASKSHTQQATASLPAGAVVLQDLWLPDRPGRPAGEAGRGANPAQALLRRRRRGGVRLQRRLLQVLETLAFTSFRACVYGPCATDRWGAIKGLLQLLLSAGCDSWTPEQLANQL